MLRGIHQRSLRRPGVEVLRTAVIAVTIVLAAPGAAAAATFGVNTTADLAGPGGCAGAPGDCSLRRALALANANGDPSNTIVLPASASHYTVSGGELDSTKSLTISGEGPSATVIDAGGSSRVLQFNGGTADTVSGVTIVGGRLSGAGPSLGGAAIYNNAGTLNVIDSAFDENAVTATSSKGNGGAAIYNNGDALTVADSTFKGNTFTQTGGTTADGGAAVYNNGSEATVTNSVFANNQASISSATEGTGDGGAAIYNNGESLIISGTTLSTNQLTVVGAHSFNGGGAVYNDGSEQILSTDTFSDNTANLTVGGTEPQYNGGGADYHDGSSWTIRGTTASGNVLSITGVSGVSGGGAFYHNGSTFSLINSTLTGNTASPLGGGEKTGGGAIFYNGTVGTFTNATIDANLTDGAGGGIFSNLGSTITSKNMIDAAGVATGAANCAGPGTYTSAGHNIESANTCSFAGPGDQVNTNALLGPLQNNGGATLTQELLAGSPAIDAGDNSGCPATDQRGVARPQGTACDIGALEVAPPAATTGLASGVGMTIATLAGSAGNPSFATGSVYFQFGTSTTYGSQTSAQPLSAGVSGVPFSAVLSSLMPGVVYHFRAVATTPDGTSFGADKTFTTAAAAAVPPVITDAAQSNRSWREGTRLASFSRKHKLPPLGTTFSFTLNEQAIVSFAFTQRVSGRKVNGKCVAQTKKNHRRHVCKRTMTQGRLSFAGHVLKNKVSFLGRISHSKKLPPGTYTLVITATNTAGQRSAPKQLSFTILK
ncbi:MAG TPA: choice-of-anchor Q domain-containing protein [Solirubrobacteraceae bacterium]|nr:choice-of-anchor Q domain-containing protein [Solirubrobacteraceae bacterium]